MQQAFSSLPLDGRLQQSLQEIGFEQMTEIQSAALPVILHGKDIIGQAKTGSGKTVTFSLGLLNKLDVSNKATQALVLCPTRELADQVAEEVRRCGRRMDNLKVLTLCGGSPMGPQISSLSHGAQVVVGTPGRVMDHLLKRRLHLNQLTTLVLDEADRMLDMGFEKEMDTVIRHAPTDRQTLLFSATYPDQIKQMSMKVQRSPQQIQVHDVTVSTNIEQAFYKVESLQRVNATASLLTELQPATAIVFCNTRKDCQYVAESLEDKGFASVALHGDIEQKQRTEVLTRFANKSARVLVATDVASRGLDVKEVELVINYQPTPEPDVHVHRIGRTGRADASGIAITLCSEKELPIVEAIEEHMQMKARWKAVQSLRFHANRILDPEFQTVAVDGGKKAKLRPGDLLGALTKDADIPGDDIGKINITATHSYIAIKIRSVKRALKHFSEGKIKGRKFRARRLT